MKKKYIKIITIVVIMVCYIRTFTGILGAPYLLFINWKFYNPKVNEIEVDNVMNWRELKKIKHLKNLDYLGIYNGNRIKNLSFIECLDLKVVRMIGQDIDDWSALSSQSSLEKLHIMNCDFPDISIVDSLVNLESLWLVACDLDDISSIKNSKKLKDLDLNSNGITDIETISYLENLEELWLFRNKDLSNIEHIKTLKKLRKLSIAHTNVHDISVLKELKKIEYLEIDDTEIEDYSVLFELPNLKGLRISEGKLTKEELNRLKDKGVSVEIYNTKD